MPIVLPLDCQRSPGGMDAPSEDIAEQRDAEVGLDDPPYGRGDHVRRRRGDLDRDEAGDADEEAEDALRGQTASRRRSRTVNEAPLTNILNVSRPLALPSKSRTAGPSPARRTIGARAIALSRLFR